MALARGPCSSNVSDCSNIHIALSSKSETRCAASAEPQTFFKTTEFPSLQFSRPHNHPMSSHHARQSFSFALAGRKRTFSHCLRPSWFWCSFCHSGTLFLRNMPGNLVMPALSVQLVYVLHLALAPSQARMLALGSRTAESVRTRLS